VDEVDEGELGRPFIRPCALFIVLDRLLCPFGSFIVIIYNKKKI